MGETLYASIAGGLRLLAVLTSALFAIAQYYENRHQKALEDDKNEVRGYQMTPETEEPLKETYEKIMNAAAVHNQPIVISLFVLILSLIIIFTLATCSGWLGIKLTCVAATLRAYSLALLILGIWLLVNLLRMRYQMTKFKQSVDTFKTLCAALQKFAKNSKASPTG